MAQQGLINNGASSQCYCDANHAQDNAGTTRVNSQPADTVFQVGQPIISENDIISTIKTIVNELSNTLSFARASNNNSSQTENMGANNTTGNDSTDQANNEGLDDFIISLIEQLLATLEGLMGGGDNNSENNPPASGNNPSTPTTVIPIDPSTILDNSVANENDGEVSNYDEMTLTEQKLKTGSTTL